MDTAKIKKTQPQANFPGSHKKVGVSNTHLKKYLVSPSAISCTKKWDICKFLFFGRFPRSNQRKCSLKKGVLKNFAKFTGNHLCQSLFFNKVEGLRTATLLKKTLAEVFSYEFCEILKNTCFTEHLRWLLLIFFTHWFLLEYLGFSRLHCLCLGSKYPKVSKISSPPIIIKVT